MKGKPILTAQQLGPQLGRLLDVLNKGTDLACALIGAAYVDHCLAALLENYLVDGETAKGLLQPGRPLGECSARRQLCYCLGLITKEVGTDLEVIAKIRHHFAHQVLDVQFTNTEI